MLYTTFIKFYLENPGGPSRRQNTLQSSWHPDGETPERPWLHPGEGGRTETQRHYHKPPATRHGAQAPLCTGTVPLPLVQGEQLQRLTVSHGLVCGTASHRDDGTRSPWLRSRSSAQQESKGGAMSPASFPLSISSHSPLELCAPNSGSFVLTVPQGGLNH